MNIVEASQNSGIATKVIKMNCPRFIAVDYNNCIVKGTFPDDLKHADVTFVQKCN